MLVKQVLLCCQKRTSRERLHFWWLSCTCVHIRWLFETVMFLCISCDVAAEKKKGFFCLKTTAVLISDSMVQPQVDLDQFSNVSNLVVVESNQTESLVCVFCMHLAFDDIRWWSFASKSVNVLIAFFFCARCEVWFIWNKQKQQSKCYTWTKSSPKIFGDRSKAILDWKDPGAGPGPELTLVLTEEIGG